MQNQLREDKMMRLRLRLSSIGLNSATFKKLLLLTRLQLQQEK
jgi:hypothetical protein